MRGPTKRGRGLYAKSTGPCCPKALHKRSRASSAQPLPKHRHAMTAVTEAAPRAWQREGQTQRRGHTQPCRDEWWSGSCCDPKRHRRWIASGGAGVKHTVTDALPRQSAMAVAGSTSPCQTMMPHARPVSPNIMSQKLCLGLRRLGDLKADVAAPMEHTMSWQGVNLKSTGERA